MASEDIKASGHAWVRFGLRPGPTSERWFLRVENGEGVRVRTTPALQALSYGVSCQPKTIGWSGLAVGEMVP